MNCKSILILLLFIVGCNTELTPEDCLKKFVYERFKVDTNYETLRELTTGKMKTSMLLVNENRKRRSYLRELSLKVLRYCSKTVNLKTFVL